jgi:hypothetical protein
MRQKLTYDPIKMTLIFLFVLISFCVHASKKAELTINISDCRDPKDFTYLSEVKVLKNEKEYKTLKPQHESKQVLKDLELGTYTLVYKSLFDKEESLRVEISEYKKYSTTLCTNFIDYSKERYKPIIDQIQENEFYTVIMLSEGCFHSSEDTVIIKRDKNIYTISWAEKSKVLTKADVEAIRHFEMELVNMGGGGCTTSETYTITYNGTTTTNFDRSCRWWGISYLKKQLFGDK